VSDIDTVVVDSLKALDPEWPIREADVVLTAANGSFVPILLQKSAIGGARPPKQISCGRPLPTAPLGAAALTQWH
jgi:hypothetical protein